MSTRCSVVYIEDDVHVYDQMVPWDERGVCTVGFELSTRDVDVEVNGEEGEEVVVELPAGRMLALADALTRWASMYRQGGGVAEPYTKWAGE
ncbi:MAG: hypothetical protein ACI9K2_006632 [Myxococcota bacterium]|jgi:hypothetical protein